VLESHFISRTAVEILLRESFSEHDYREFLTERNKSLLQGVQKVLISEELEMGPAHHELDIAIEEVELGIRKIIIDTLGEDPS
jgi:hypothetical protein